MVKFSLPIGWPGISQKISIPWLLFLLRLPMAHFRQLLATPSWALIELVILQTRRWFLEHFLRHSRWIMIVRWEKRDFLQRGRQKMKNWWLLHHFVPHEAWEVEHLDIISLDDISRCAWHWKESHLMMMRILCFADQLEVTSRTFDAFYHARLLNKLYVALLAS